MTLKTDHSEKSGIGSKITKEELKELIGKYVELTFTTYSKRNKCRGYFELFGHIKTVEDKNIEFRCNYNHLFIVSIARIINVEAQASERRTEEEWQLKLIKDVNKAHETIRKKTKEIQDKEPLITLNY